MKKKLLKKGTFKEKSKIKEAQEQGQKSQIDKLGALIESRCSELDLKNLLNIQIHESYIIKIAKK